MGRLFPSLGPRRRAPSPDLSLETKGAVERRATSGGPYTIAGVPYRSSWSPERAVQDGLERVVWVYRCVDAIASDESRLPMVWRKDHPEEGDEVKPESEPLWKLLNRRPNPFESAQAFRYRLSCQLLLCKQGVFVEVVRARDKGISRLHLLPPHRVAPIPDPDKFVSGYEIHRSDGVIERLAANKVLWIRRPHPLDPYLGLTPMEAAGLAVDVDFYARILNRNLMMNDGRPGGLVNVKGFLSQEDADELDARFNAGPGKAGRVSIIESEGLDYVDFGTTARDMQYSDARTAVKREVYTAFGVPETRAGDASQRCVDMETEALTQRGWLRGDEITTDDTILSMDPADGRLKWSPVHEVYRSHYSGSMYRLKHRHADFLVTPGHKWAVEPRPGQGRRPGLNQAIYDEVAARGTASVSEVATAFGIGTSQAAAKLFALTASKSYPVERLGRGLYAAPEDATGARFVLRKVEDLSTHDQIRTIGDAEDSVAEPVYSSAFVELVGWVVTEGHYVPNCWTRQRFPNRTAPWVRVRQKEGPNIDRIERCLKESGAMFIHRTDVDRPEMHRFDVRGETAAALHHVAPDRVMTFDFLLALTGEQRQLLMATMLDADGSTDVPNTSSWTFAQKNRQATEAFVVLATLCGYTTSIREREFPYRHNGVERRARDWLAVVRQRKVMTVQRDTRTVESYDGEVWCPRTAYGTFIARRNGITTLTGNTFDNADAELEMYWRDTMRAHNDLIDSAFDELTKGGIDDDIFTTHDTSSVFVLNRDEKDKEQRFQALWSAGLITADEFREGTGREPLERPGSSVIWVQNQGKLAVGDEDDEVAAIQMAMGQHPAAQTQAPAGGSQAGAGFRGGGSGGGAGFGRGRGPGPTPFEGWPPEAGGGGGPEEEGGEGGEEETVGAGGAGGSGGGSFWDRFETEEPSYKAAYPNGGNGSPHQAEPRNTGIMVSLDLPGPVARALLDVLMTSGEETESPADLHVTLAYLGKVDQVPFSPDDVLEAVEHFAQMRAPLVLAVSGVGHFSIPEGTATYASVDCPDLADFRQGLVNLLRMKDVEGPNDHGFTPHITLAYTPPGEEVPDIPIEDLNAELAALTFVVAEVAVHWGDTCYKFPLRGERRRLVDLGRATPGS